MEAQPKEIESYRQKCSRQFPYADIFQDAESKERRKNDIESSKESNDAVMSGES